MKTLYRYIIVTGTLMFLLSLYSYNLGGWFGLLALPLAVIITTIVVFAITWMVDGEIR